MPLNRLENFIKNIEGRILYVNPNDLDSTDSISNDGNSLAQPFKTIQRALVEAARFSYQGGDNNDYIERTTILVYPGEHIIDNRPGYKIKKNPLNPTEALAYDEAGNETSAINTFSLTLDSNFDIEQEDNILYKFNSIYGGVVVPRGTSIVGLDLRKTKIRPKYVPHPIDPTVDNSAIFRITGACYFWQFSIFDGDTAKSVYTNPISFTGQNDTAKPTFSHHKLTCFEYADGVNIPQAYEITDLDMYYAKLSNAFNQAATDKTIPNADKFPVNQEGFTSRRPEYEIVGAFANDPIDISQIISGNGATPSTLITVTTRTDHGLNAGTPVKINGVADNNKVNPTETEYNISTFVSTVPSSKTFTYLIPQVPQDFPADSGNPIFNLSVANATVTIETDTVSGASPYIFNCSLRSVYGMNGMWADGNKATGFRSMVVAQFTGISLQKDDRSFVKYDPQSRTYKGIPLNAVPYGDDLSQQSSSLKQSEVYHLDSDALYRKGWETCHIRMTNDAIMQIVSVFAIGYNRHFSTESGGDASITNANSNFGQISLNSDGFKKEAFSKDDQAYLTNIITPKSIPSSELNVDWFKIDVGITSAVGVSSHLYLSGFTNESDFPPSLIQGYRIGANANEKLYVDINNNIREASITMVDSYTGSSPAVALGSEIGTKTYRVVSGPDSATNTILNIGTHGLTTGEKIRIFSDDADLPENIEENIVYYAIVYSSSEIKLASTLTNAKNDYPISIYGGTKLSIQSRVHDKEAGDIGSPIQYDDVNSNWYVHTNADNTIYTDIDTLGVVGIKSTSTKVAYVKRIEDSRSLDDKIYKLRVVIPKESTSAKNPEEGFIIQESSSTGARENSDFTLTGITTTDFNFNRNPRFISTCSVASTTVTVVADIPHDLKVGENVIIKNVKSTNNPTGTATTEQGYNGTFAVTEIVDAKTFKYFTRDILGISHNPGSFTNDVSVRDTTLPRFERNDLLTNFYIYRNETIEPYIRNIQDGIYHLYALNASNRVTNEFTNLEYSQNVVSLYPELDRDNGQDNPSSTVSAAKRSPLGDVAVDNSKNSLTRESIDKLIKDFGEGSLISNVTSITGVSTITFDREHKFGKVVTGIITAGTGYEPTSGVSTYHSVKLLKGNANPNVGEDNGVTASVTVQNGGVVSVDIISGGSGYSAGIHEFLFDNTVIKGATASGAAYTVDTVGLTTSIGNVIQLTGIGTITDSYYRVASVPSKTTISVATTTGDTLPYTGQYAIDLGPSIKINSTAFSNKITTFTNSSAHGLVVGNSFRILDSSNNNLGDFLVNEIVGILTFKATTNSALTSPTYILKHGLSANNAVSDSSDENIASRGLSFFSGEVLTLGNEVTSGDKLEVSVPNSGIGTVSRFPLGSYLQIGEEIMRVISSTLTGSGNNEITVLRGVLGTLKSTKHEIGSLIKKVNPLPIEFRRPSIIRASGHTFEYIGYGPGNYSTGLPQVQVKSLTEREEFLVQSQERSCGAVVYTGMNNRGDFFIGNKRVSSATGQERTFDAPIPSVTGEDPSRLSVIFDEVVCKERIIVEGGKSSKILSQFDGPVTFNGNVKINANLHVTGNCKFDAKVEFAGGVDIEGGNITSDVTFKDGVKAIFGDHSDLWISHSPDSNLIQFNSNGLDIKPQSGSGQINIISNTSLQSIVCLPTGEVSLYKSGNKKLETSGIGVTVSGELDSSTLKTGMSLHTGIATFSDGLYVGDNKKISLGNSSSPDMEIIHDTANSIVRETGTGSLYLQSDNNVLISKTTGTTVDTIAQFSPSSFVKLGYGGNATTKPKFSTTATGIEIGNATENEATGNIKARGDITAYFSSDERLKTDIKPIEDPLAKVLSISGNTFTWKAGHVVHSGEDTGVIAQEIEKLGLPGVVTTRDSGYKAVKYEKLVPLLIEAIKELKNEVDELKKGK